MDEAVRRFERLERDGIILTLDADCTVSPDYFTAAQRYFLEYKNRWSGHYPFEHIASPEAKDKVWRDAIETYELHLRYFITAQRFAGFPFAFQTLGSCIAVTSKGYQNMGGMNLKQAGEDFHFLQKFIEAGKHGKITGGCVFPSGRGSFRVPFGTGKGVLEILSGKPQQSYSLNTFYDLKSMISALPVLYQQLQKGNEVDWFGLLPASLQAFFLNSDWQDHVKTIYQHTASYAAFRLRFFRWFNALRVIQFAHACRENTYPDELVYDVASKLYKRYFPGISFANVSELLQLFRAWDLKVSS
jgi:hypothetical protein